MNRRNFLKGIIAAAVVAKVGFYAVVDKIIPPSYAEPYVIANGASASGFTDAGNGWYQCWATWSGDPDMTNSVWVKSILNRETNEYPIPVAQFTRPIIRESDNKILEHGMNIQSARPPSPWGIQLETGPKAIPYVRTG